VLEEIGDQLVSVVTIVGQKGIGKSYIGNAIVNRFNGKAVSILIPELLVSGSRGQREAKGKSKSERRRGTVYEWSLDLLTN
jgi:nicotinamide riboside kinase